MSIHRGPATVRSSAMAGGRGMAGDRNMVGGRGKRVMTVPRKPEPQLYSWPTRIVVVLATYSGVPSMPDRRRGIAWRTQHDPANWWHNTSNLTFVVYQRQNASLPNYSPNIGFEAGVIIQFVLEHYDGLPDITLFMQDRPEQHNPHWMEWSACLKPNMSYAPMTNARMARLLKANAQTDPGTSADDAIVEQCWRNMLDAFGAPLLMPREQPLVSYFQGSTFAASRTQLRATSYSTWQRVHAMVAGGDGRCHHGPVQWERLSVTRRARTKTHDTPDAHGKHTSANAFEALQHILVGGFGREEVFSYDYCKSFLPDCPRTPCGRVRPSEKYHGQMLGRVEFERRRLGREYAKLLRGLRRVASSAGDQVPIGEESSMSMRKRASVAVASSAPTIEGGASSSSRLERTFRQEFGWLLGEPAGLVG